MHSLIKGQIEHIKICKRLGWDDGVKHSLKVLEALEAHSKIVKDIADGRKK